MLRLLVLLILITTPAVSEESGPREAEHKAEITQSGNQNGIAPQQIPAPFPFWFSAQPAPPIVNVITGKHAEGDCTQPKNWKEWGSFAWCRSVDWLDAEKTIAIFTVILGIATGFLWWATRNLVNDARETSRA